METILQIIIAGIAILVCLIAYFLVLQAVFPGRIEAVRTVIEQAPGRALLVGLVNAIFAAAVILAVVALASGSNSQVFDLLALVLIVLLVIAISAGLAGVVQIIGERLLPDNKPAARTAWGAALLSLACAVPFIGWFGLLVYTGLLGLGAWILTFFRPARRE